MDGVARRAVRRVVHDLVDAHASVVLLHQHRAMLWVFVEEAAVARVGGPAWQVSGDDAIDADVKDLWHGRAPEVECLEASQGGVGGVRVGVPPGVEGAACAECCEGV